MAGAAGEVETITSGLSLLVNLGKVILQNAKQEAEGKNSVTFELHIHHCVMNMQLYNLRTINTLCVVALGRKAYANSQYL